MTTIEMTTSGPAEKAGRGGLTRRTILDAAAIEFADKGYDGGSMRLIARNIGLEIGHIQHHFRDKSTLWDATVSHVLGELTHELKVAEQKFMGDAPEAVIAATIRVLVQFAAVHPNFVSLITRTRSASSPLSTPFRALDESTRATIRLIEQSQANGTFVRGNSTILLFQLIGAALRIFSALDMSVYLGRSPFEPDVVEAQIQTCISIFMPGYAVAPEVSRTD